MHRVYLPFASALALIVSCSSPPPALRWQNTGGPLAQDVTALLVEERAPDRFLAGHATGEISSSTDQGRSWTPISTLPGHAEVFAFIPDPDRGGRVYAATAAGAFASGDGGKSWSVVPVDETAQTACRALAVDPFDNDLMFAGLDGQGVYRSTDGGAVWASCELGIEPRLLDGVEVLDLSISTVDPNTVYAALSRAGVMKSTDRGMCWSALTKELAASGTVPVRIVQHGRRPELLCFGTRAGDIYRSSTGGATWTPTRQGNGNVGIRALVRDPSAPDRLLASTEAGILESADFGRSWQPFAVDLPRLPCGLALAADRAGTLLVAWGEGIGVRRSPDGGRTWQAADRGLGGSTVRHLAQGSRSGELFAVTGSAIHVYRPGSSSWVSASDGLTGGKVSSLAFDTDADSILYAGTPLGVFRSQDGGRFWSLMPRTFGPHPVEFVDMHLSIRTRMFVGTPSGLYVSTDRGTTWRPSRPAGERFSIRSFTYAVRNSGVIHAATRDRGIFGSTDGGLGWETNRYGIEGNDILAVTRDRDDERLMYCWTAGGGGFRSRNRGMEWDPYAPPWKPGDRISFWVGRNAPHTAVALVNGERVFTTSSAGATWKELRVERLPADVESFCWSAQESALYAGTRERGVFRLPLSGAFPEEDRRDH